MCVCVCNLFTQLKGDIVYINHGTVHWVQVNVSVCGGGSVGVGVCIVANRPGMAGTVPEFWALSRWYPGCPGIYTYLALRLSLA